MKLVKANKMSNRIPCPRVHNGWNLWNVTLFLVLISIPAYHGTKLKDYDLIVSNGNNLMFSHSLLAESPNIAVVPKERYWQTRIEAVVPDVETDLIYLTIVRRDSSSIAVYNLKKNQIQELDPSLRGSIVGLTLYQNYLYWCDQQRKSILKINVEVFDNTTGNANKTISYSPEVVLTDSYATFESFAIHPVDGIIYYTKWRRSDESEILSYEQKTNVTKAVVKNVYQPHGLFVDTTHLYWISNAPGSYFIIERMDTANNREQLYRDRSRDQNPFAIFANCSTVYWTDTLSNILWEFELTSKSLKSKNSYKEGVPYGFAVVGNSSCQTVMKHDDVISNAQIDVSTEKSTSITAAVSTSTATSADLKTAGCHDGSGCKENLQKNSDADKLNPKINDEVSFSYKNHEDDEGSNESAKVNAYLCKSEENHCENGASCLRVNDQMHCLCQPGFFGPTCTDRVAVTDAKQPGVLSEERISSAYSSSVSSWPSNPPFFISCIVFSTVVIILLVVILILVLKVRRLDQKPRIRRRVVVNHRSDLDDNPSVCEMIDIENCCNMNVCETPCYERGATIASAVNNKNRTRKNSVKEDKKCLLNS